MKNACCIVLLGAGASTRLGRPKQSIRIGNGTLLEHSVRAALGSGVAHVLLVLGAAIDDIILPPTDQRLTIVINPHWQEGIAASIRAGLQKAQELYPGVQQVLFMPCDQPHINPDLLDKLVNLQQETGKPIAASQYAHTIGIPAVFSRDLFVELMALTGDAGAKKIMLQRLSGTVSVPFPGGEVDIDTEEDLAALLNDKK